MTLTGDIFMLVGAVMVFGGFIHYFIFNLLMPLTHNFYGLVFGIGLGLVIVGKMINNDAEKKEYDLWRAERLKREWELERRRRREW